MSLDVYLIQLSDVLKEMGIFIRENGQVREVSREEWNTRFPDREPVVIARDYDDHEVFHRNITHNLGQMADAANLYAPCWRPDEIGVTKASQLIEPLKSGLVKLKADPAYFQTFNPSNGWGDYEGLVDFVESYLVACEKYPNADVGVSR